MSFTLASYNVLATSYIQPEWYPLSPKEFLDPVHRIPALVEHLVELQADILCLQEVEGGVYEAIDLRLSPLGYTGSLARKGRAKPDGCASFFRTDRFEPMAIVGLEYEDAETGEANSGHVAQILALKDGPRLMGIANTHLKWDPPNVPRDRQYGYRQMGQLLRERSRVSSSCSGWIVCGDLNVTVDSDVVALLRGAGFEFSHAGCVSLATCNPNRQAKMIDFVFHDRAFAAEPLPLPSVGHDTPLPGGAQPSDHVAVRARLDWRDREPSVETFV